MMMTLVQACIHRYHKVINIIVSILTMAIIKLILITIFYPHIAKEICPPHISPTSDGFRKDGNVVLLREKLKEGALPRRDVPLHRDHQRAGGGGVGGQGGGVGGGGGGGGEGSEQPRPEVGEHPGAAAAVCDLHLI